MSNKFLKKEYLISLAIIIGTIVIGVSIYLGTTLEYRDKKMCVMKYGEKKEMKIQEIFWYKRVLKKVC